MQVALACAADARYVMPLAVMVRSVIANLRAGATLSVYVADGGVPTPEKERLSEFFRADNVSLEWLDPPAAATDDLPTWGRMPSTTYYRLLIADLLPADLGKLIWLDCDLVVTADLGRLWEADLAGSHLLAVQDVLVPYVSSRHGIRRWRQLGLPHDAKYFNAGVMVIDLERWRADAVGAQASRYLLANRDHVVFWDQEGLNAVLCGRWRELDPRWNHNASVDGHVFSARAQRRPARRTIAEDAWIVHFSGGVKPWLVPNPRAGPRALYFRHLDETPWAGWRPRRSLRSILLRTYESSGLRSVLYRAEAWWMLLVRNRTLSGL
jgi:lipopolysaccharide biosynthesis glycosyltransferase